MADTNLLAQNELLDPTVAGLAVATNSFLSATTNSLIMILVTELGDKTFFIAAILAMRYGRFVVYAGAMGALGVMHILSSLMGYALPALLPRTYTHFASAVLFVYFGFRLLKDAYDMEGSGPSEELQEVEEELRELKGDGKEENEGDDNAGDIEARRGDGTPAVAGSGSGGSGSSIAKGAGSSSGADNSVSEHSHLHHAMSKVTCFAADKLKIFTEAFTLTFLAEWGDRSQIATIALAAAKNPFGVVLGGLIGHAFCTGLAVIGGKMLAARISERAVAVIGGVLFLFFGVTAFLYGSEFE